MNLLQTENNFLIVILAILAVLIPIVIIFFTLRMFRKKRERGSEKAHSFGRKFKSVKEERIDRDPEIGKTKKND